MGEKVFTEVPDLDSETGVPATLFKRTEQLNALAHGEHVLKELRIPAEICEISRKSMIGDRRSFRRVIKMISRDYRSEASYEAI